MNIYISIYLYISIYIYLYIFRLNGNAMNDQISVELYDIVNISLKSIQRIPLFHDLFFFK